jgi:methylaspartate ammonia-lyase
LEYVSWLRKRVFELGQPGYFPTLHIDVYGTIGMLFNEEPGPMAAYLGELAQAAEPLKLRIEGPMDAGSKEGQIQALKVLKPDFDSKTSFLGGSGPGNPMFSRAWFRKKFKNVVKTILP